MARIRAILRQRTHGNYGHFLNHRQSLSHCGQFLYYDTRNADPDIIKTTRIESLDLIDDTTRVIYDTQSRSDYGPGVGAVVCHPLRSSVLFIHGLTNCDQDRPYAMTRRFGAWAGFDPRNPAVEISALESRKLASEPVWGALSGGTHAHSFSPDGRWVSFTYNDARLPDRRTVGFTLVDRWESTNRQTMPDTKTCFEDNFDGVGWSALALIPEDPIESAREECWISNPHDAHAPLKLAMIVRLRSSFTDPKWIDEIYVAEFPEYALKWPSMLQGPIHASGQKKVGTWGYAVPMGIELRRLTHSDSAVHPGVAGPRHWLQASNCGRWVYTMMRDSQGTVRVVRVEVSDGRVEFISENQESITHPISIDPGGRQLSYLVGDRLRLLDLQTGEETEIEWDTQSFGEIFGPVQFLRNSQGGLWNQRIFWNARPKGSPWLQIWTATLQ